MIGIISLISIGCTKQTTEDTSSPIIETEDTEVPESFEVTGQIVDDNGSPIEGANVLVGGRPETLVFTDENGNFSLWYTNIHKGTPAIVASKFGYRTRGYEFFKPDAPISISLREITGEDNTEYTFQEPGDGSDTREENCSHCHTDFAIDFWSSKHSESASNPLLHDLYAGVTRQASTEQTCMELGGTWRVGIEPGTTNSIEKCYLDHGVLSDLNPTCDDTLSCDDPSNTSTSNFGGCADCHAPGINGALTGRNLHDAVGLSYEAGIHCDTCHKVKDVDMSKPAGYGSRLVVHRPSEPGRNTFEWDPVYYGPLIDVANVAMAASPQDKFNQSVFCAGCHEHNQPALLPEQSLDESKWPDGLPIQTTFSEWEAGPFNTEDTPCQYCHMPAYVDKTNAVDIATVENQSITFGFPREPEDVRQHIFRSPFEGEPRLIDTAAHVSIVAYQQEQTLNISTSVANVGCGHAIPTGEPLRALYVVIEVDTACGQPSLLNGPVIDELGGYLASGRIGQEITLNQSSIFWENLDLDTLEGNFLKILRDTQNYDDYNGIGYFTNQNLSIEEKGLKRYQLIGETEITNDTPTENGHTLGFAQTLNLQDGDLVYLVSSPSAFTDGMESVPLTGQIGQSFAKVLIDPNGTLQTPHYRAVDIIRDNRIAPGTNVILEHQFQVPEGCSSGDVEAKLIYRPLPMNIANQYHWEAQDFIIAETEQSW